MNRIYLLLISIRYKNFIFTIILVCFLIGDETMKAIKFLFIFCNFIYFFSATTLIFADQFDDAKELPSYLFIQSAKKAQINKEGSEMDNHYKIILNRSDPWVIYFSERPHRNMGFMSTEDFLSIMKKQSDKFEPKGLNVAIVSLDNKNKHKSVKYVFTLQAPQYKDLNTITFYGTLVPSETLPATTIIPPRSMQLSHVVLFIDACVGCTPPP